MRIRPRQHRQASAIILENTTEMSRDEREGQPRPSKEGILERELEPFCPTLSKTGEEARAVSGDPWGDC